MNNFNKSPSFQTTDWETEEKEPVLSKKELMEKIQSFDIKHLTHEDIGFMNRTIRSYFCDNFPVDDELMNQLEKRITILNADDYERTFGELCKDAEENFSDVLGFYSQVHGKIFINAPAHENTEQLFVTMFHESLHLASIETGGGFAGDWLCLLPTEDEEAKDLMMTLIDTGRNTLIEGTTQLIVLASVVGDMGFDRTAVASDYISECAIMNAVWLPFSREEMMQAYFKMSIEDLRIQIEKTFTSKEERDKIDEEKGNGLFTKYLYSLGLATENMNEALWNPEDDGGVEDILREVRNLVAAYIMQDCENNGIALTAENRKELRNYIDPYEEDDYV